MQSSSGRRTYSQLKKKNTPPTAPSALTPPGWLRRWDGPAESWRLPALLALLAVFGLALHAATWPLWLPASVGQANAVGVHALASVQDENTLKRELQRWAAKCVPAPQPASAAYPQVPLIWSVQNTPAWLETAAAAVCVLSLALLLAVRSSKGWGGLCLAGYLLAAGFLMLLDQHRIQAWTYQFCLLAVVFLLVDARRALAMARLLVVSIYLYSAWSKFDYVFLHTVGVEFARTLLAFVARPDTIARVAPHMAWLFPVGELAVGLGLCFRRTRTIALAGAIVMHLALLLILGPWGLQHQNGVLLWNGFFLGQAMVLFAGRRGKDNPTETEATRTTEPTDLWRYQAARWTAALVLGGAVLAPLGAPWGWWDRWPAWSLYAPGGERLTILIHQEGAAKLPAALQPYLQKSDGPWRRFRPDLWSLNALHAPEYPQNRCRLGVAIYLAHSYKLGPWIQAVVSTSANRFTGERRTYRLVGVEQMESASARFVFNARPRLPRKASGNTPTAPTKKQNAKQQAAGRSP